MRIWNSGWRFIPASSRRHGHRRFQIHCVLLHCAISSLHSTNCRLISRFIHRILKFIRSCVPTLSNLLYTVFYSHSLNSFAPARSRCRNYKQQYQPHPAISFKIAAITVNVTRFRNTHRSFIVISLTFTEFPG